MPSDMYGRTLCRKEKCPAYVYCYGERLCNANLMYESNIHTLCRIPEKYILDMNHEKQ